jgi:hypothetical protein
MALARFTLGNSRSSATTPVTVGGIRKLLHMARDARKTLTSSRPIDQVSFAAHAMNQHVSVDT